VSVAVRPRRLRVRVTGTVQGVGFRPYVYRLAGELGLAGFVLNDARGVLLEVEGTPEGLARFLERLRPDAPPLAALEHVDTEDLPATGESAFVIRESPRGGVAGAPVTQDTATCPDCLAEVLDPADRRFRYPFTNCTNCGPRFTIVRGVPYDRLLTTMAGFQMCRQCAAEYEDPADRRFHAQPNACPECGPSVWLAGGDGAPVPLGSAGDAVQACARALLAGRIVAVKGVGGFHLACRADEEEVVARLRARKHREDKPFALMVASMEQAQSLVEMGEGERELLGSPGRPIVLAARRQGARVAAAVAPGAPELGLMLPYSPLHHLLALDTGWPLVMTSGNVSDEPIAYSNDDALARLGDIADLFLLHDRPIATRTDDSVRRVIRYGGAGRGVFLRRSRGYVPGGLALPGSQRPLLGCGAELKNTFCVAKGGRAWVSHHIGDLQNYETLRSFTDGIEHFERLFAVRPELVVHDLHPEYLSTKYALEREGVAAMGIQHHHAHLAACLAEHGETGPAVGAIFDGTGYGMDGTVWGGELLFGDTAGFTRIGHLLPVPLPGGERAIREPWRMACAWLLAAQEDREPEALDVPAALGGEVDPASWSAVARLAASGLASPVTTSMGRLFDAVAALCGVRPRINYEGQAAIELEAACEAGERGSYAIAVLPEGERLVIDPRQTVVAVREDVAAGRPLGAVASRFHNAVAQATVEACGTAASGRECDLVVLSGGVFQNRRLLEAVIHGLARTGLRVRVPERLPLGDGGISYGQAAVAARRLASKGGWRP
jgi:hydrogenase maturation protein HypF